MTDVQFDRLREVEYVIGACQLFRKEAQVAAGWIDPRIFYGPMTPTGACASGGQASGGARAWR
jgi:hypothetical protein